MSKLSQAHPGRNPGACPRPARRQLRAARARGAPTPTACRRALAALAALHGMPDRGIAGEARKDAHICGERDDVLAAVIATLLSQHTTAKNAGEAMDTLWAQYNGNYLAMLEAGPEEIARAIRVGGLSNVKGARIHALLQQVRADTDGEVPSLEHLRDLSDEAAKAALTKFAGVGPKTASCVLLFALGRHSFAVDTHVLRIAKRLGWVAPNATRESAYLWLDARVPAEVKYPLHVLLVHHGKCCPECAASGRAQRSPEGPCPLTPLLPSPHKMRLRA